MTDKSQTDTPQSLSYILSERSSHPVTSDDIGGLIGKGASGLRKTISQAWRMYEQVQRSDKKVEEDKPNLRIVLKETSDGGVETEIISSSETMRKLAQLSMDNHLKEFFSSRTLQSYTFVAAIPHHLLGQLIGKKASGLNRLLEGVYTGKGARFINQDDIETAQTARLRIKELDFSSVKDLSEFVKKRRNTCFIGWPPEHDESYVDHISLTVTFSPKAEPFVEINAYIECLQGLISDRIQEINEQHEEEMKEIDGCLGY